MKFHKYPKLDFDESDDCALLPAWFTERMMHDDWTFGLLLANGHTLVIDCPLFDSPVHVEDGDAVLRDGVWFLDQHYDVGTRAENL